MDPWIHGSAAGAAARAAARAAAEAAAVCISSCTNRAAQSAPYNPFEGSQTGSRAHPLRFGLAQAAFAPSFALAALERQKDMRSAGCVALRLRFCARTWPFDLDFARSDGFWEAPDVDFRG